MSNIIERFKRELRDWSVIHFVFDGAVTGALSIIIGALTKMSLGLWLALALCIFVAISSGTALLRKKRRTPEDSISGILEELADDARFISSQELAKDWCENVQVAIFGTSQADAQIMRYLTQPIYGEKPSAELITARLKRASIFLRATAVRIRKGELLGLVVTDEMRKAIKQLYDELIASSSEVSTKEQAKAWCDRVYMILCQTGQQLKAQEMMPIVNPLWRQEEVDVKHIVRQTVEFIKASSVFVAGDNRPSDKKKLEAVTGSSN